MNKKTTQKLAAYSALAAGVMAVNGTANAQITYVDINPDETYTADHQLDIDLNADAVNDFTIWIGADAANRNAVRVQPGTGNEVLGSVSGNFFYPFAMDLNQPVGPSTTVWNGTMNGGYMTMAWVYVAGGSYGNWLNATDKYLGVRFLVGTNVHYGWIRFSISCSTTGVSCTYKDFAFNTVAEQQILAGTQTVGLEDATTLSAKVFTAGEVLHVQFEKLTEGEVVLTNMLGQAVMKSAISDMKMELPLESLDAGLYLVTINGTDGNYTQKIFVK